MFLPGVDLGLSFVMLLLKEMFLRVCIPVLLKCMYTR